jgi:hypothetical protein
VEVKLTAKGAEILAAARRRFESGGYPTYAHALKSVVQEAEGDPRIEGITPPEPEVDPLAVYSACSTCARLINEEILASEDGYEMHISMGRDDPDYAEYMAAPTWVLAFAIVSVLAHQRDCPIYVIETGQRSLSLLEAQGTLVDSHIAKIGKG